MKSKMAKSRNRGVKFAGFAMTCEVKLQSFAELGYHQALSLDLLVIGKLSILAWSFVRQRL
jgi:hypothetical protein